MKLYTQLAGVRKGTSVWTAIRCLVPALENSTEEIRYLLLWVGLEALFGANAEITHRISQRIAFFVGKDRSEARGLYRSAKKAYEFRSKVAHGVWRTDESSTKLTGETETLLRKALVKLLLDGEIAKPFLGKSDSREKYLDWLVFDALPS